MGQSCSFQTLQLLFIGCLFVVVTSSCAAFAPNHCWSNKVRSFEGAIWSQSGDEDTSDTKKDDDDDAFMAALRSRVATVQDRETKLPLVLLDSMLPRQVLKLQIHNPLMMELVKDCLERERPFVGMLGMARIQPTGQMVNLNVGVECKMVDPVFVVNEQNEEGVKLEFHAGRRFKIAGDVEEAPLGWTECRVDFLESDDEEEDSKLEEAQEMAKELTVVPHPELEETKYATESLVDRWISLAKENERSPGQIDELLECLGPIPPADEPSDRAFWIGALVNPLPAMGVALEIRPQLLLAKTAKERVEIALEGISKSIGHMDGSARLW